MTDRPHRSDQRRPSEEIIERAGEQPPHPEGTPIIGASRASTPPYSSEPPEHGRTMHKDPNLPPGAR